VDGILIVETGLIPGALSLRVLFATPHGLHVRSSTPAPNNATAGDQPHFKSGGEDGKSAANDDTQKCDVLGWNERRKTESCRLICC